MLVSAEVKWKLNLVLKFQACLLLIQRWPVCLCGLLYSRPEPEQTICEIMPSFFFFFGVTCYHLDQLVYDCLR